MQNIRAVAALSLSKVIAAGEAFSGDADALSDGSNPTQTDLLVKQQRDTALYREICYGTLRHYFSLKEILSDFLQKPLAKKDSDIQALLLIGLYQIIHLRTPNHAALSETVNACKALKKNWAKGLVNAVLRNYLRSRERGGSTAVQTAASDVESAASMDHPQWLLQQLQGTWPQHWRQIVDYNNAPPPMTLRLNLHSIARDEYLSMLAAKEIGAQAGFLPTDILLTKAVDIAQLPHFDRGWVSVQDSGAQLAAPLLELEPGMRVLDACAAPGGKAVHMLQHCDGIQLTAMDISQQRLQQVESNLLRCGFNRITATDSRSTATDDPVALINADAASLTNWWGGQAFDRILLDAPCSATGVISHHPDIKLLRRASDPASFRQQQQKLLTSLWPALKEGGELLYCTCSLMPEENQRVIAGFLAATTSAKLLTINADWGIALAEGRQLLPYPGKNGGFFYARLSKRHSV